MPDCREGHVSGVQTRGAVPCTIGNNGTVVVGDDVGDNVIVVGSPSAGVCAWGQVGSSARGEASFFVVVGGNVVVVGTSPTRLTHRARNTGFIGCRNAAKPTVGTPHVANLRRTAAGAPTTWGTSRFVAGALA
jgi:hypothetical protein